MALNFLREGQAGLRETEEEAAGSSVGSRGKSSRSGSWSLRSAVGKVDDHECAGMATSKCGFLITRFSFFLLSFDSGVPLPRSFATARPWQGSGKSPQRVQRAQVLSGSQFKNS